MKPRQHQALLTSKIFFLHLLNNKLIFPSSLVSSEATTTETNSSVPTATFNIGDKVEGNFRGRGRFFPGKISAIGDGTYDIEYDDGEVEKGVSPELLRAANATKSEPEASDELVEGMKVEGQYRGKGKWYPGKIQKKNEDGTFDIYYDDGEQEKNVVAEFVRNPNKKSNTTGNSSFSIGLKVEGNYRGRGKWYPARIKNIRDDGTFDIDYDDGETESRLPTENIRIPGSNNNGNSAGFQEGMKVEADYRGKGKFFPGKVVRDRGDGTYDIDYDDGEKELRVPTRLIRSLESDIRRRQNDPGYTLQRIYSTGAKIEGNYRNRGKFFPGRILAVHHVVVYDIEYDDGERESKVLEENIRSLDDRRGSPSTRTRLEEGMKVEANYRGRGKYFPGKIRRDRGDGTYDIDYDDGESELRVDPQYIRVLDRSPVAAASTRSRARVEEGAKIEANYRAKGKWYPGRIRRDRGDGTFDIDYDDGETESRVKEEFIRLLDGGASTATRGSPGPAIRSSNSNGTFSEGAKVEGNYRGRGKWYPARIKRDRGDGTYDIDYDDGEMESRVKEEFIRPRDSLNESLTKAVALPATSDGLFVAGAKIEANYRGRGRYFPGRIKTVHEDGTIDVDYDDGETESKVGKENIRLIDAPPSAVRSSENNGTFSEGAKVEGNYRGKGKWYPARIKRDRGDGTYDIDYDDGEMESRVKPENIRLDSDPAVPVVAAAPAGGESANFQEGDKVEIASRGKVLFSPGRIRRVREDGTYDVDLENGETEVQVKPESLRDPAVAAAAQGAQIKLGDKVEANYRGRGRYFPGKIRCVRDDGTYDVDYDDGETESRVKAEFIRLLDQQPSKPAASIVDGLLKEGDKVEANYRGRGRYFPGKIKQVREDGTFDVDYDDGEAELKVSSDNIRSLENSSLLNSSSAPGTTRIVSN